MFRFVVVSLFPNIPLKESIDLAADYVYSSDKKPPFSKDTFKKLLGFATGGIFSFNNRYYRQTDGVMMGSPLGPTLANLFLAHLERNWMNKEFSPVLYRRYVDDIFCIFKTESDAMKFFEFINQQHPNLRFTLENAKNNEMPFLDVNVIMKDHAFDTHIYRKSTYTGLLLNYNAVCPQQWKKGLILGTLHRAYTACSSWSLFHMEVEKFGSILKENGYPMSFYRNIVKQFVDRKFCKPDAKIDSETPRYTFRIPYVGNPSLLFKKKLKKMFKSRNIDINIVFSSTKVRNYFSLKDRSHAVLRSSLVYKFECLGDPSTSYIGKTKRYLEQRVNEHSNPRKPGAVCSHISNCHHCQSSSKIIDSFTVLHKASSDFDLQIIEALQVREHRPILNKQLKDDGTSFFLNIW